MIVSLRNATIARHENVLLKDVNLEIVPGDFVYLVGRTGSGKSSLLKTLYGENPLKTGSGSVCGFDLVKLTNKQIPLLRRKLGIVFQDFELLSDRTVMDNLAFVLEATGWKKEKEMQKRMNDVLEQVGLGTKGHKRPHELSGGEQQRVGIARALLNDPELILADEPTGNLDPGTTDEILALLHILSQHGKAVLMATHDYIHMKKFATQTLSCENGRLIASEQSQQVL